MHTLSTTVEINPTGSSQVLTVEQVWRGLVMKAENALPFVPGMTRCDVVERSADGLVRDISVGGNEFREKITFFAPVQVHFDRIGNGGGWIQNTISESDRGLLLSFTFSLPFPGTEPGSAEERAKGEAMRGTYVAAVNATLAKVRDLVAAGEI